MKEEKYYDAKEYWEWRAKKYGSSYKGWKAICSMGGERYYHEYVDMLGKKAVFSFIQMRPGMKVLDVGCGVGRWCVEFAKRGADVTGVDISEEMIRIASENMKGEGLNGHLVVKSIDEIDFPDNSFDLVNCIAVLMHVTDPEKFRKGCRNIVRVTRPGGQILLGEWAPKTTRESRTDKHMVGRAYHEYRERLEGEGVFLIKERGIYVCGRLDQAYDKIAAKLVSILKKRAKRMDEPAETKEFMEATYPKLTRLFHLGRRALITSRKPVELYLVPLPPFRSLTDYKLMLFQKEQLA